MLCCGGNDIYGNSSGSSSGGGGGGGSAPNHIISPDTTSSVTCNNGGIIESVGDVDFNDHVLSNVKNIIAGPTVPLTIVKDNVEVLLTNNLYTNTIGLQQRVFIDNTTTTFLSDDGQSGQVIENDNIIIATGTNGTKFSTDATSTVVKNDTEILTLTGGTISSSVLFETPSLEINNNYLLPTTAPTTGQFIGVTGSSVSWISAFNGFQSQYTGAGLVIAAAASTQSICNTLLLGSGYNTGTFTYTAPLRGIYQLNYNVNWEWTSTTNPANGRLDSAFMVADGGTTFPGYNISRVYAALGTSQPFNGSNNMMIFKQLNSGATVRLTLANNSSANNMTILANNTFFSARLIQEN